MDIAEAVFNWADTSSWDEPEQAVHCWFHSCHDIQTICICCFSSQLCHCLLLLMKPARIVCNSLHEPMRQLMHLSMQRVVTVLLNLMWAHKYFIENTVDLRLSDCNETRPWPARWSGCSYMWIISYSLATLAIIDAKWWYMYLGLCGVAGIQLKF